MNKYEAAPLMLETLVDVREALLVMINSNAYMQKKGSLANRTLRKVQAALDISQDPIRRAEGKTA